MNKGNGVVAAGHELTAKAAAEILNNMGGGEKAILETIAESSEEIAAAIRDEMFTFEDVAKLDKKAMQKILGQIDTRSLAVALKATTLAVEDNVFKNLSKRAGDMVEPFSYPPAMP